MRALYSSVCVYEHMDVFSPPVQDVETSAIYVNAPLCATPRPRCVSHLIEARTWFVCTKRFLSFSPGDNVSLTRIKPSIMCRCVSGLSGLSARSGACPYARICSCKLRARPTHAAKHRLRDESGHNLSLLPGRTRTRKEKHTGGGTDGAQPSPREQRAAKGMKDGFCSKKEKIRGQYFLTWMFFN